MNQNEYFCLGCDEIKKDGCWVFTSVDTSVWPIDGKEHSVSHTFCICPDCIEGIKSHMSPEELETLRWEDE
jgi:hypothetical protein